MAGWSERSYLVISVLHVEICGFDRLIELLKSNCSPSPSFEPFVLSPLRNQISVWQLENGTHQLQALCYANKALYWLQESLHQHLLSIQHNENEIQDLLSDTFHCRLSKGSSSVPSVLTCNTTWFFSVFYFATARMQRTQQDVPRTVLLLATIVSFSLNISAPK